MRVRLRLGAASHSAFTSICHSRSLTTLFDKGFHLYLVAIGANGDGPVMVGAVDFCSQGVVAFQNSPGGQMERVAKADGKYCDSGLKSM